MVWSGVAGWDGGGVRMGWVQGGSGYGGLELKWSGWGWGGAGGGVRWGRMEWVGRTFHYRPRGNARGSPRSRRTLKLNVYDQRIISKRTVPSLGSYQGG